MTTQTTSRLVLFPITRQAVTLTALGEQVAGLIAEQRALPETDTAGRAQLDREINALLGLED
jgi:hypothetical protein